MSSNITLPDRSNIGNTTFIVGQDVRVISVDSACARRGIVAIINEEALTADIIFSSKSLGSDEECNVPFKRIKMLENFELTYDCILSKAKSGDVSSKLSLDPFDLKDKGNIVFNLHDFDAAFKYYNAALLSISTGLSFAIGSDVLICSKKSQLSYFPATIICSADEGTDTFEVEYDDVSIDEPPIRSSLDMIHLAIDDRILGQSLNEHKRRNLQRSLYMNLAKTHMKIGNPGWAIRYCSISIGIVNSLIYLSEQSDGHDKVSLTKFLIDAYFVRAKVFLSTSRPDFAQRDAAVLRTLEGGFGKANQLEAESVKRKVDIRKLNRRLVSNLMEWVDNSMTGLGGNNHLDDLPLDAMLLEQAAPHEISTSCSPESKPTGVQAEPKEATQGDCSLS